MTKSDSPSEEISEPVLVETKKPKKKTQPAQTEDIEDFNVNILLKLDVLMFHLINSFLKHSRLNQVLK